MDQQLSSGSQPSRAADDTPSLFGRFRILRTLAFGGMAQILLAREERSGRLVVLKRILPHYAASSDFVQFFIHEGRLGQRLVHPNLVQTLEAGQVGATPYIALEYLRGQPAIELLRAAARAKVEVPLGVAVRIVADAARGLHHAHTATSAEGQPLHVVHRDVTPHNLFVCTTGLTKVLDFGIAKAESQLHHTRTGTIKGKFAYLAPEQVKGDGIDQRVDVFALGIVLHELLTLRPLFRGSNDGETLQRVLTLEVPPPERIRQGVPPGLGAVALRALMRDRDRRLPTAEALADSIEAVASAEGIDASSDAVAGLLHQLFPDAEELDEEPAASEADGAPPETPPQGVGALPQHYAALDDAVLELGSGAPKPIARATVRPDLPTSTQTRLRRRTGRIAMVVALAALLVAVALVSTRRLAPRAHHPNAVATEPAHPQLAPLPKAADPAPSRALPQAAPRPPSRPAPAQASLRVEVAGHPSFVVDGRAMRPASDGALHLAPGRHSVVVSSGALARARTITVDLKAGEAALRAVRGGRGTLRIAASPWAEVQVDGRELGTTPLAPADLSEGPHTVTLRNSDLGVTTHRRVMIAPDHESLLKINLFAEKK
ncbi:MAG TPA: serine/threonine-protein kinase [Polyangia bacterium]